MTSIKLSSFSLESVNQSVILEALEHLKGYIEDTDYSGYFCDLSNESLGCDPYVIYHASAKEWINKHELDVFDVIEDVREYHNDNFGEFSLEVNPENVVTAYMSIVLGDVVNSWLSNKLEADFGLDLWDEEVTDDNRKVLLQVLTEELEAIED